MRREGRQAAVGKEAKKERSTTQRRQQKTKRRREDVRSALLGIGGSGNTEVFVGRTVSTGTTEEEGVVTSRGAESQLIDSQAFTTSVNKTSADGIGELQGDNGELGALSETNIVGDGTDVNDDLVFLTCIG
jgi:hypothetical protein